MGTGGRQGGSARETKRAHETHAIRDIINYGNLIEGAEELYSPMNCKY